MAQECDPLSKANKSGIFIEMQKNCRWVSLLVLYTFSHVGFNLSKLDFKNWF
jgi:hypothetical protein